MDAKKCDLCREFYIPLWDEIKQRLYIIREKSKRNSLKSIDCCPTCYDQIFGNINRLKRREEIHKYSKELINFISEKIKEPLTNSEIIAEIKINFGISLTDNIFRTMLSNHHLKRGQDMGQNVKKIVNIKKSMKMKKGKIQTPQSIRKLKEEETESNSANTPPDSDDRSYLHCEICGSHHKETLHKGTKEFLEWLHGDNVNKNT